MDNLFKSLKKLMYEYTHLDDLTPRRKERILETYSKYANNYDFVDELIPVKEKSTKEEDA